MTLLQSILLGIVEGLTEFLPISSTAHLMLAADVLRLPPTEFVKTFEIAIQAGAILAVVVLEWKRLTTSKAVWMRVLAAFVPTAIAGYLLHDIVKSVLLESIPTVLWSLSLGGIFLILYSFWKREKESDIGEIERIPLMTAVLIGLAQAVAIVPGVSRAAATIIGGELLGIKRKTIVEFSFLLAVPTIAAAAGLDLLSSRSAITPGDLPVLLVGSVVSFIVALVTMRWFLGHVRRLPFAIFGIERIAVAVLFLLWMLV